MTLAIAATGLLLPASSLAQKGGASGLMQLEPRKAVERVTSLPSRSTKADLACPQCKDTWEVIAVKGPKGTQPEMRHVSRHHCTGCRTSRVSEGHGKMKIDKVVHECRSRGGKSATCCK